jgi:hypothetical protein
MACGCGACASCKAVHRPSDCIGIFTLRVLNLLQQQIKARASFGIKAACVMYNKQLRRSAVLVASSLAHVPSTHLQTTAAIETQP